MQAKVLDDPGDPESSRDRAYRLGVNAFQAGAKRVPAFDRQILTMLEGKKVGEGVEILDAWLKGWDDVNLFPHEFQFGDIPQPDPYSTDGQTI